MFQISAQAKYTHFHVRVQYSSNKKYVAFINIKNTYFEAYTYRGSEKRYGYVQ